MVDFNQEEVGDILPPLLIILWGRNMAKQKIQFFYVDNTYVEYLKKVDSKVPNMVYDSNRKFVCGIVLAINGYNYYAPVSSNTTKNRTSFRIKNIGTDKVISSVRLGYMFPVPDELLTKIETKDIFSKDPTYGALLIKELLYCNKYKDDLIKKASKIYDDVVVKRNEYVCTNCCDFATLESACSSYFNQKK